ncbi:TetR/AcrR family transcriptional regulator [Planosporangium thailandense]|uniref:TetR/AcrR family transcriptional regulator n=1 Tax=Planosporangium thailandense TaxID=765197 RepID=A0ABX0XXI5_9ACTN|nr:TetR/AcrR family transcriptional regulator [Planosporangium thailandense]NJC70627.1 TetR/AcrR family transcriptional regulator [Planosporangium thailandense]
MASLSRKQQREQTRQHLLDAAVACLVEYGYAGTTTQRVQERAGVSRGALLHHFGSKADLFVAAIHHIAEKRLARVRAAAETVDPGPDAEERVVAAMRAAMSGPPFLAALELWMSARTDPALRAALIPAERGLGKALREIFDGVSGDSDPHEARIAYESLLVVLRGLAVTSVLRDDRKQAEEIIRYWIERMAPSATARRDAGTG